MRRASILQSTKQFVQTSTNIFDETAGLIGDQIKVTRELNSIEDGTDIKEAKVQSVMDVANITATAYAQLATIDAMAIPDEAKAQLKANLLSAIA